MRQAHKMYCVSIADLCVAVRTPVAFLDFQKRRKAFRDGNKKKEVIGRVDV